MKEENKIAASVTEISETKAVKWRKIFHDTISIRIQDPSRYSDWYEVSHVDSLWKQILPQKWLHPGKSPQCTQCTPSLALEPTPLHCTVASLLGKIKKKPSTDKHLKKIHVCQVQDACLRCVSWCTAMSHPPGCMSALSPWRRKRMACRTRCATRHTRQAHKCSKRPSSLHLLFQVSQNVCDILHVVRNIDTR